MEAIARKRLVTARYNGAVLTLAPHILFERHGDLFISALNLSKTRGSDDDIRLGQFKLIGLGEVTLLDDPFEPIAAYVADVPRDGDTLILAV